MTLHDLLARVESATGMDREIDAQVHEALVGPVEVDDDGDRFLLTPRGGFAPLEFYTASVDATIALQERVLPGWRSGIVRKESVLGKWECYVHNGELAFSGIGTRRNPNKIWETSHGDTPALAHLSAIIRALIAKGESDD